MGLEPKDDFDSTSQKILRLLADDARLPFAELGRRVGLSTPAVIERVRRMEDAGLIRGYHADVDPAKIGYPMTAFVRLHTAPEFYADVRALISIMPEVLECYHVTGEESFVIKVMASSTAHLESVIARFDPFGKTATSIVLSTALERRVGGENLLP